ncbi:MAG: periplasmic heavy metal sensor [Terriglobales bacterium]
MKIKYSGIFALLLFPLSVLAQTRTASPSAGVTTAGTRATFVYHSELGKWWQNSEIAKKLQLGDGQIAQLDQTFYDHKLKLIDYGAEMEKQDLKLQSLLDADVPNEGQVEAQVDQVLSARGKLEREFTMMNLDLRKVLSLDQWRQLKSIRGQGGAFGGGDRIFFRKVLPPSGGPVLMTQPPGELPAPPPPPLPEDMY